MLSGPSTQTGEIGQNDGGHKNKYHNMDESKRRFTGEVDLPESERRVSYQSHDHTHWGKDLEPLLAESRRRLVLFPIQYPDVSRCIPTRSVGFSQSVDMEDVQAGPGVLLERRRD
jgi:hypothetical protein